MLQRSLISLAALLVAIPFIASCATLPPNPVPFALEDQTRALDPKIQVKRWGDQTPKDLGRLAQVRYDQYKATRPNLVRPGGQPVFNYLAISGGGADGAFGAGLLVGWSASGQRPQFEIVTGVSTGALAAPFAFLGSKYDPQLREIYTTYSTRDLLRKQPIRGLLGGQSLADSTPLANLIARYVDQRFLNEVAKQYRRGRRLLIGTTNIDAQRPVIWDMGAIAASGRPGSLELFRRVLLASASIPGAFPPVVMDVASPDGFFQERHVDGGTTKQVFLLPSQLMLKTVVDDRFGFSPQRQLYIIRNGRVAPEYKVVKSSTLAIAQRSISTLIKYQGIGDLYELHELAARNGMDYRLAYIPRDFEDTSTEVFDPVYMQALFKLGYAQGKAGYPWEREPPGLD
jgi:hypothetical protein